MKNAKLYNRTMEILYEAYFNDTLRHRFCQCCFVGNLVCKSMGYQMVENPLSKKPGFNYFTSFLWSKNGTQQIVEWNVVFTTYNGNQTTNPAEYKGKAKVQIDSTGYTWQELAMTEKAFETGNTGATEEEKMFNGLAAVIEVLNKIHEVEEDVETPRFKSLYETKCNV